MTVAIDGLSPFVRNKGMLDLLSHDSLNILELDVSRPLIIFLILPEETTTYDPLAASLSDSCPSI